MIEVLELVSSSYKTHQTSEYDQIFRVSPGMERLPFCGAKDVSPLRNRVAVEIVSHMPEVQIFLRSVKTFIDSKLSESRALEVESDGSCVRPEKMERLCVCVCCSTGAHVSVCCVERLWDVFSRQWCGKVKVSRRHEQALTWDRIMAQQHNLVWQQSMLPVKYTQSLDRLREDRVWKTVPWTLSPLIEEEFQKDPLSSSRQVGGKPGGRESHLVNFEVGELYSHRDMKMYRLRCVLRDLTTRVDCRMVDGPTYKKMARGYGAAGVLFYSTHPVSREVVFLLGHMNYSSGCWCDFGGLKSFRERPRNTAARECYEETLGVVGRERELYERLGDYKRNHVFKVVNKSSDYVAHFLYVAYDDYLDQFKKAVLEEDGSLEVDDIKWFSLSSLREVIRRYLMDLPSLWTYAILPDGSLDHDSYHQMRLEFVQTLCMAEQLDILHSLEHITRNLDVMATTAMMSELAAGREDTGPVPSTCGQQDLPLVKGELDDGKYQTEASETTALNVDTPESSIFVDGHPTAKNARDATNQEKGPHLSSQCKHKHCRYLNFGIGVGRIL